MGLIKGIIFVIASFLLMLSESKAATVDAVINSHTTLGFQWNSANSPLTTSVLIAKELWSARIFIPVSDPGERQGPNLEVRMFNMSGDLLRSFNLSSFICLGSYPSPNYPNGLDYVMWRERDCKRSEFISKFDFIGISDFNNLTGLGDLGSSGATKNNPLFVTFLLDPIGLPAGGSGSLVFSVVPLPGSISSLTLALMVLWFQQRARKACRRRETQDFL